MALLLTALLAYCVLSAASESAQIKLRDAPEHEIDRLQRQWHVSDAMLRVMLFTLVSWHLTYDQLETVKYTVFGLAVYWLLFDAFLNAFRDRPAWYVGQTAAMDKALRVMAGKINVSPEVFGVLIKLAVLGLSFLVVLV